MGRVAMPFGVQGWIKIQVFTQKLDSLVDYPTWQIRESGSWKSYPVLKVNVHGTGLIAHLAGCNDRDTALRLKGCEIAIPRDALPAAGADEYYWADLIGLRVVNSQEEFLGTVAELLTTGANDVLVVQGERQRLLPFIAQVIIEVDLAAGQIKVAWEADF